MLQVGKELFVEIIIEGSLNHRDTFRWLPYRQRSSCLQLAVGKNQGNVEPNPCDEDEVVLIWPLLSPNLLFFGSATSVPKQSRTVSHIADLSSTNE
jgi:hypothetical protein